MCCVMVREKMSWEANLRSFLASQQSLDWSQLLSHAQPWEREQRHGLKELNTRGWTVEAKSFSGTRRWDDSLNHQRNAWWDYARRERTRQCSRFSAASPMMIFPPLLLVFSTESAVLRPCSCFPRPWPSLKPYFCMILWATVPLCKEGDEKRIGIHCTLLKVLYRQFKQESLNTDNELWIFKYWQWTEQFECHSK